MKINLKKLSIVFLLTITGCNVNNSSNKEEIDNFTLLADENKKTLDDGKAFFYLTIDSNSNLKNHNISDLSFTCSNNNTCVIENINNGDKISEYKWLATITEAGNYTVNANFSDNLSSSINLIANANENDISNNLEAILNETGGLKLGGVYDIGLNKYSVLEYRIKGADGVLKFDDSGKLEVIGMDNAKLSLLKNNIEIKSMYFSVAHSILSTNIKNELISSKVIESQSSKVTNDMLLKVKKLSLKDELKNDIECTVGLKYLTELEEIDISNNDLSDVSWLSSCTKLKKVDISNNRIKNFNQIVDNQDLQYLDASNNEINDISKIKFMQKINYLDLSNNEITDISDVSTSYGLESLFLNNNNLTVFKDRLSGLENLNELGVGNCNIPFSDIISLKYLNKLSYLDISGTNPTITQISNLGNLKTLVLKNCRLNTKNLSSLNNLNNLEILDISNNNLDSESYNNALDGTKISNLNSLFIGGNAFMSIPDLSSFDKLKLLDLTNSYNLTSLNSIVSLSINSLIIDDCFNLNNDLFIKEIDSINNLNSLSIRGAFNFINRGSFNYICSLTSKDIKVRFLNEDYADKYTISNDEANVFFSFDELNKAFTQNNGAIVLSENNGCQEIILSLINESKDTSSINRKIEIDKSLYKLSIYGNEFNKYNINFNILDRKRSSFAFDFCSFNNEVELGSGPVIKAFDGSKVIINSCNGSNTLVGASGKVCRKGSSQELRDVPEITEATSAFEGYDLFINSKNDSTISLIGGKGGNGANKFEDNKGNSSEAWGGLLGGNGACAISGHNIQLEGKNIIIIGGAGGKGGDSKNDGFLGISAGVKNGKGGNGGNGVNYSGELIDFSSNSTITGGTKGVQGSGGLSSSNGIDGKPSLKI